MPHPRNPPFGEINKLPVVRRWGYRYRPALALLFVLPGLLVAGLLVHALRAGTFSQVLIVLVLGVVLALAALFWYSVRGEICIDQKRVSLFQANLLGQRRWEAPLAEFRGVELRIETWYETRRFRGTDNNFRQPYKLYSIVLAHPEADKDVWLYHTRDAARADYLWTQAAALLNLPTLGQPLGKKLDPDLEWD